MLDNLSCNVGNIYPTINVMPTPSEEEHRKSFGAWIKKQRKDADLTQIQVAEEAGITDVQLARIEKGESGTKRETAVLITKAINKISRSGHKVDVDETLNRLFGRSVAVAYTPHGSAMTGDFSFVKSKHGFFEKLKSIDFDIFDENELNEILRFIEFKAVQKSLRNNLTEPTETALTNLFNEILKNLESKSHATSSKKKTPMNRSEADQTVNSAEGEEYLFYDFNKEAPADDIDNENGKKKAS